MNSKVRELIEQTSAVTCNKFVFHHDSLVTLVTLTTDRDGALVAILKLPSPQTHPPHRKG